MTDTEHSTSSSNEEKEVTLIFNSFKNLLVYHHNLLFFWQKATDIDLLSCVFIMNLPKPDFS